MENAKSSAGNVTSLGREAKAGSSERLTRGNGQRAYSSLAWTEQTSGHVLDLIETASGLLRTLERAAGDTEAPPRETVWEDRQGVAQVVSVLLREAIDLYANRTGAPVVGGGWLGLFRSAGIVATLDDALWVSGEYSEFTPLGEETVRACARTAITLMREATRELVEGPDAQKAVAQ